MENEEIEVLPKNAKSVDKSVLFYHISTDAPALASTEYRKKNLILSLNNINEPYIMPWYDSKIQIEKIKSNEKYFFGSICKMNDNLDFFTKIKSKTNDEEIDQKDLIFNYYTYFYIDYESLGISIIISKSIQTADKIIENLLNKGNFNRYTVVPLSKNLSQIENSINTLTLSLFGVEDFEPIRALNKLDCEVSDYKVNIKLKKSGNNFIENIKSIVKNNKGNTRVAKIGNDNESYDLLRDVFSIKAKIKVYSNYENNIDSIRQILEVELFKAIQT